MLNPEEQNALLIPQPKWLRWLEGENPRPTYWMTRFLILRLLGFLYLMGFMVFIDQGLPLLGENGLIPTHIYLEAMDKAQPESWNLFLKWPTLFWLDVSDGTLMATACLGALLSMAVVLGVTNGFLFFVLWLLYSSFTNVGHIFYGFGWENQLLETGFLAIFFCSWRDWRPFSTKFPPPVIVIWLYRWLIVRIMLGSGLIKIRGDLCWRDLSCLVYHYETQPIPNPISFYLHHMPKWFHELGVLFNHFVELVVPFFALGPRKPRHVAGFLFLLFQITLIISGNLSFLNWLTIIPCLACFDDTFFKYFLPTRWKAGSSLPPPHLRPGLAQRRILIGLFILIALLSIQPTLNIISPNQIMNTSFDPFQIVNTYGAFGSVGKERSEIILWGSNDDPKDPNAQWKEYEFKCKPGNVMRPPCWMSPFHYRLDWHIWFAAMSNYQRHPWLVHLIYKLLHNDQEAIDLIATTPFVQKPPRFIKAELYRYGFADMESDAWWKREYQGVYLPPLSKDDPRLLKFLGQFKWFEPKSKTPLP